MSKGYPFVTTMIKLWRRTLQNKTKTKNVENTCWTVKVSCHLIAMFYILCLSNDNVIWIVPVLHSFHEYKNKIILGKQLSFRHKVFRSSPIIRAKTIINGKKIEEKINATFVFPKQNKKIQGNKHVLRTDVLYENISISCQ